MSDDIQDLARQYEEHVLDKQSRHYGLFPIPEYPELEAGQGMWSAALEVILTTLRYLAPATLLTLFWGQQSFLFKLLKSIDSAFRAIVFSSEEQKQEVLQWLAEAGPVRIEHLETVWRHGWILCGVLDSALPGACAGHPPTRLSLKHAQAIADHYLGVEPVFSRQELESNDALSRHQEWKLATYLDRIRQALAKLTPPVSKPQSQRTSPETIQFTLDYIAKGSGLTAAQVKNKAHFKVCPTSQQSLDPGEITILIRGPKDTYGMSVIPPVLGNAQLIRQKLLGLQTKAILTENALPITQGTTYLRNYGKNDMTKTYYIPKSHYDIGIETESSINHAKISYTVHMEGKYEIYITSRGQNIVGSPFTMTAANNIIDIFEKDNEWLENGEEIDIVDVKTDRKVVLRIVDFVSEKMLLKENGVLEKISDDDANVLMSTDGLNAITELNDRISKTINTTNNKFKSKGFKETARKVVQMNRVCNIIKSLVAQKPKKARKKYSLEQLIELDAAFSRPRSQQDVPDIVNSTFSEMKVNPFITEQRDKFIVPKNITVSLCTEKATPLYEDNIRKSFTMLNNSPFTLRTHNDTPDSLDDYSGCQVQNEDNVLTEKSRTSSNPFLTEMYVQDYAIEKELGSFVKTEYETNNSQHEETEDGPIRIIVDEEKSESPSPINMNPFSEPDVILERPKTPVFKIITGDVKNRDDSVYIDPETEGLTEEIFSNEFINPFFLHGHQSQKEEKLPVTDFIIGAPVSLPPLIRASTPEPHMESLLITSQENTENLVKDCETKQESINEESESIFSTPLHTIKVKTIEDDKEDNNSSSISSSFHSLDANTADTDSIEIISLPNISEYQEGFEIDTQSTRDITNKKDIWDSAYVSIDDNNSTPDSNNNDNQLSEITSKQRFSLSDDNFEISNMGPAEREIWQSCAELQDNPPKQYEEVKNSRWEVKRPTFTPILEESDRSMSTGMKETARSGTIQDVDTIKVAFPELRDVYGTLLTNSDCSSTASKEMKTSNKFVTDMTKRYEASVDSASESPDVKRHEKELEGKISEVQVNVTESVSVSQTLQKYENELPSHQGIQFGDSNKSNIVLEKKQYWDKKIREIEAMSLEENKCQQKRRRLSARHLRNNDSLTKRRGKQIVKNFLNANDQQTTTTDKQIPIKSSPSNPGSPTSLDEPKSDVKLVEKWKKFWDNKLDTEKEVETTCFRAKSPKSKEMSVSPQPKYKKEDVIEAYYEPYESITPSPVKQELSEEVFKAFETSPKRFFGTSRKQILNKIDTFLGKPSTADESSIEVSGAIHHDIGLVSSRISLFHNISQTEEVPWTGSQSQSMHNIFQGRGSKRSNISEENKFVNTDKSINENDSKVTTSNTMNTIESNAINVSFKDKISRMSNKISNFEETTNQDQKPIQELAVETQTPCVKKSIGQINRHSKVPLKNNTNSFKGTTNQDQKPIQELEVETLKPCVKEAISQLNRYSKVLPKNNPNSFEETTNQDQKPIQELEVETQTPCVKKAISQINRHSKILPKNRPIAILKKSSFSKSEMDIFKKFEPKHEEDDFDKYKSCDELPTINVKNFITLYESVSKTDISHPVRKTSLRKLNSTSSGTVNKAGLPYFATRQFTSLDEQTNNSVSAIDLRPSSRRLNKSFGSENFNPKDVSSDVDKTYLQESKTENIYVSLSDIELEIVEKGEEPVKEKLKKEPEISQTDYKARFKMAKEFFQSMDEIREVKKPKKLNECEMLLLNTSTESTESPEQEKENKPQKKKSNIKKSHSMPSSEMSKYWKQLQENIDINKLVKISEKFNVDDLFNDVMEGRLSRQGSLRGIPHKKAVLETFKSMESLTDNKMSPYEMAVSQLQDFAEENQIKNAQTYLTEYPYLPTTDPSKYHSRLDTKASGLISLKELKERNQKPRRNSVPDLRLNTTFTVNL